MPESSPPAENLKQLFEAIKEGNIELVRTMLRDDPSLLNAREERGYTPLGAVLRRGKNERVEAMVHMGGIMVLGVVMILVTLHDFHVF